MKSLNRDLLLISRKASTDQREIEIEIEKLNRLLLTVECVSNLCAASELIDVNSHHVTGSAVKIERVIRAKLKPFQFINNKN